MPQTLLAPRGRGNLATPEADGLFGPEVDHSRNYVADDAFVLLGTRVVPPRAAAVEIDGTSLAFLQLARKKGKPPREWSVSLTPRYVPAPSEPARVPPPAVAAPVPVPVPAPAAVTPVPVPAPRPAVLAPVVVPRPGAIPTLASLTTFLDGLGIARQKYPEYLVLVDGLPRTPTGKVQKFRLRTLAAERASTSQ